MMQSKVPSLIDAVDMGEVKIDFLQREITGFPGMSMSAKYALVITSTGTKLGAGNRTHWSDATHEKLRELIASMESDIATEVFGEAPPIDGGEKPDDHNQDGVQGL